MDVRSYNRMAWDHQVAAGNRWTQPVSPDIISAARAGQWSVVLTPMKPVPDAWFPELTARNVLCLASGGGQQAPILAAAGAKVTVLDNSPKQLEQDRKVAEREKLDILTIEGDMRDLSTFPDESFDLIFHPVSNTFVPDVRPVWLECARVLRKGGVLMAGFTNPVVYIFDLDLMDEGQLVVTHSLPYSDLTSISTEKRQKLIDAGLPLEFSHTLEDQIGGQLQAGLVLTALYEDYDTEGVLARYLPTFMATRALKL